MQEIKLNRSQKYAASFYKGAMLVLAGPGSGKTAVITSRILFLIEEWGVPPENILVITFSKAAAEEMKNRFRNIGRYRYESVTFGTFHAIFFRIIREACDYDTSNIISEREKNIYLDDALKQAGVTVQNEREFKEKLSASISALKNSEKQLEKAAHALAIEPGKLAKIYDEYTESMKNAGKIDFDDMMLLCLEIFMEREDILKKWQDKFKYILIDE